MTLVAKQRAVRAVVAAYDISLGLFAWTYIAASEQIREPPGNWVLMLVVGGLGAGIAALFRAYRRYRNEDDRRRRNEIALIATLAQSVPLMGGVAYWVLTSRPELYAVAICLKLAAWLALPLRDEPRRS